jgi:hypothetical protein
MQHQPLGGAGGIEAGQRAGDLLLPGGLKLAEQGAGEAEVVLQGLGESGHGQPVLSQIVRQVGAEMAVDEAGAARVNLAELALQRGPRISGIDRRDGRCQRCRIGVFPVFIAPRGRAGLQQPGAGGGAGLARPAGLAPRQGQDMQQRLGRLAFCIGCHHATVSCRWT